MYIKTTAHVYSEVQYIRGGLVSRYTQLGAFLFFFQWAVDVRFGCTPPTHFTTKHKNKNFRWHVHKKKNRDHSWKSKLTPFPDSHNSFFFLGSQHTP